MKAINNTFNFRRARNAEHYQVHEDLLAAISEEFATAQGIKNLRDEYAALFEVENDCYLRNRAYEDTPEINEADQSRDDIFLFISQTIQANLKSPVEANRQAAGRLDYAIDPYKEAPRLPYAQNTAAVSDYVKKMEEETYSEDIATLGLATSIAALKEANEAFNKLYLARSQKALVRATSETMKTVRPKVDAAFKEIATAINALYHANSLINTDEEKEKALAAVIDLVNAILRQLQETLSRAGIGSKPSTGTDDKPVTGGDGGDDEDEGLPSVQ